MKVRIEQDYYGDEINLNDLEVFVSAVRAATEDFMHPELQIIQIEFSKLVYERNK